MRGKALQFSTLVIGILVVLEGQVPGGQVVPLANEPARTDMVNERLGLRAHQIVELDLPPAVGSPFVTMLTLDGQSHTLAVAPHDLRHPGFRLLVQRADGVIEEQAAPPRRTYRGVVRGVPGSAVAGSLLYDGLKAVIQMPWRAYYLEPLAGVVEGSDRRLHVLYRGEDAVGIERPCGGGLLPEGMGIPCGAVESPPDGGGLVAAEIAFDADVEYFNRNGGSVPATMADIESMMNAVSLQYETQVDISYQITTILVRTAEPDPYSSTNPETLVYQFRNHWVANQGGIQRDLAHLMTGKELDGSVIGIAFVGVVCDRNWAYGLSQSRFSSSFAQRQMLTAHETGHNWDAGHCDQSGGCLNCCNLRQTMCSYVMMNPTNQFSSCSVDVITAFRDTRWCLGPACTAPSITQHPSGRTICVCGGVTFNVQASGSGPLSFLWRRDGVSIPGATSSSLLIDPVRRVDAGTYDVRVSNACGQVTSNGALLTVDLGCRGLLEGDPLCTADLNFDCLADLNDFAFLQGCFTGPGGGPVPTECQCADADFDLDVDLVDWGAFQAAFTAGP